MFLRENQKQAQRNFFEKLPEIQSREENCVKLDFSKIKNVCFPKRWIRQAKRQIQFLNLESQILKHVAFHMPIMYDLMKRNWI